MLGEEKVRELLMDPVMRSKIQRGLPYLFEIAEMESARASKIGMEVGSLRERILVALLMHIFGRPNVEANIPITEPEIDVRVFNYPLSIKTITGKKISGVKLIWTVDAEKALSFYWTYQPKAALMLVHINWTGNGGLYYIPLKVIQKTLKELGRENFIKLPKAGTNPRGVEISSKSLENLVRDTETVSVPIQWVRQGVKKIDPYMRWIEYWKNL